MAGAEARLERLLHCCTVCADHLCACCSDPIDCSGGIGLSCCHFHSNDSASGIEGIWLRASLQAIIILKADSSRMDSLRVPFMRILCLGHCRQKPLPCAQLRLVPGSALLSGNWPTGADDRTKKVHLPLA